MVQLPLELPSTQEGEGRNSIAPLEGGCRDRLRALLAWDLNFHDRVSGYASHNFHPFPAKFPPQLPRLFITGLTQPGERVLDPMVGSGTTVVEAFLADRWGIAVDLDPLALLLCRVKTTPLALDEVERVGIEVWRRASRVVEKGREDLEEELQRRFDSRTRDFIGYWFLPEAQIELIALAREIDRVKSSPMRSFLWLAFSAIVIAKSGGVSLARDLAHTRPHRDLSKPFRSPLAEFKKRLRQNLRGLGEIVRGGERVSVIGGNAQRLPLPECSVDLIVTSPPYAANAIDYMRAHKFSLVWMGYPIGTLSEKRREYIGGEALTRVSFEPMPVEVMQVVTEVGERDERKARVLHRYYSEMRRCLVEMYRVLRPGRAAVVVVGTSSMRGVDTHTQDCLARIGEEIGFEVVGIGVRRLDRDRRMMPARREGSPASQIERRMHEEYVIGFYKPEAGS